MILNPRQQEAIDNLDGPLMVVAGPGTGKTQILSARVASILEKTDLLPDNILCLTFSDAAATAMRKRLIKLIGPDAHRVAIHTFHGFCQKVITDYQFEMGVMVLEPVSDLEEIQIYNRLIDKFPLGHPLKHYKMPYLYRKDLIKLNGLLKQEQISQEWVNELIRARREELPFDESMLYKRNTKEFKKGDVNPGSLKKAMDGLDKLEAAVQVCYDYRKVCDENGRYDFNDMIQWVIAFLSNNEYALLRYQEQYQYIMVDEYQDTNHAQNKLTFLLASYWEKPNLMVVGDDDQSIYRFQGANVENLHDFRNNFSKALKEVVLNENYRSSQPILDTASYLIGKNTERLVENKNLVARSDKLISTGAPLVVQGQNVYYEAAWMGREIEALVKKGVPYSEMAVIYRQHRDVEVLANYFRYRKIPVYLKKKSDVLHTTLIQNILDLLKYISEERTKSYSGEHRVFRILHFNFWDIPANDLARMAMFIRQNRILWRDCIKNPSDIITSGKTLDHDSIARIRKVSGDLEYWITQSFNLPLQQLVEKVISKGGILSHVLSSPEKHFLLQSVHTLFDHLKEETRKNPLLDLEGYLSVISTMSENGVSLETEEILQKGDGVNLLTAHASKGLEFEAVFIIGCNAENWDKCQDRVPFGLRNLITGSGADLMEENRRLFYVAATRAKSLLTIFYYTTNGKNKEIQESLFVTEILESKIPVLKECDVTEQEVIEVEVSIFGMDNEDKDFNPMDKKYLEELTQDYVLSATHLESYLTCPVNFFYRNLLQIPSAKTGPLSFGNAVHKALEMFFKTMLRDPDKRYPDLQQFKSWYQSELERNRDSFTPEQYTRMLEYGSEKVLPTLFHTYLPEWEENKNREPEKNITNVVVNEVPIKGKLDQLLFYDKQEVHVIDFKTGRFSSEKRKTLEPPVPGADPEKDGLEKAYGGNYWRQVAFYHLLLNNDPLHHYKTVSGEMFFVEPDKDNKFTREKIFIDADQIKFMEKLVAEVYARIKNHEFSKGCGECEWCQFNKYYLNKHVYTGEDLLAIQEE